MEGLKFDGDKLNAAVFGKNFMYLVDSSPNAGSLALPREVVHIVDQMWLDHCTAKEQTKALHLQGLSMLRSALRGIPLQAKLDAVKVFEYGVNKYGLLNYAKGLEPWRLVAAFRRHVWYYPCVKGEPNDEETGYSHAAHATCSLLMLIEQFERTVSSLK